MSPRVKRLPRLWCAMQGLLPLDACSASARETLAGRVEAPGPVSATGDARGLVARGRGNGIAVAGQARDVCGNGPV